MKNSHIHKFRRDKYSTGKSFYYCINGNCTFKIETKHSLGKLNLCNSCGNPFEMNEYSIRAAKPKCLDCVKRRTIKNDVKETINAINQTTASDSLSSLSSRMENLTSNVVVKEYNPDDEDLEL